MSQTSYEFSLDGKKIAILLTWVGLLGLLIFVAGLLLGASVNAPDRSEQASASGGKGGGAVSELSKNPLAKQGLTALQKSNPALAQGMKLAGNPLIKKQMAGSGKGGGSAQANAPAGEDTSAGEAEEAGQGGGTAGPEGDGQGGGETKAPAGPSGAPPKGGSGAVSELSKNPLAKQGLAALQQSNPALAQGMKLAGNPLIKKQMAGSGKGGGSAQAKAPAGWEGGGASAPSQEKPSAQPPEVGAGPDARKDAGSSPKEEAPAPVKGDPGGGDGEADFETSSMGFAVQVGAFLMEKNARSLAADLEGRGYTPYVFKAQDAKDRTWYAVRMGDYGDKKEASQAASEFEKKEKMRTVVRPAGAF